MLAIILSFCDCFLDRKYRAVEICIECLLFIISSLLLLLSCILYLTGRGEYKMSSWRHLLVKYIYVCVGQLFFPNRKIFFHKHAYEKTEPDSLTFESWSEIIKKATFCQIERYRNTSWSHVVEKSWNSTKRQLILFFFSYEIVLLFRTKPLTLNWDTITIFGVLRGTKSRASYCMPKQFLWKKLADISVLITVGCQVLYLMDLSPLLNKKKKGIFPCLLLITAKIKDAFLKIHYCCGFNDKT